MLAEKYKRVIERIHFDGLSLKKACEEERLNFTTTRQVYYQNEEARAFKESLKSGGKREFTNPQIDKALLDDLATNIVHGALTESEIDEKRFRVAIEWLKVSGKFTQKQDKEDRIEDYSELMKQLEDKGVFVPTKQ